MRNPLLVFVQQLSVDSQVWFNYNTAPWRWAWSSLTSCGKSEMLQLEKYYIMKRTCWTAWGWKIFNSTAWAATLLHHMGVHFGTMTTCSAQNPQTIRCQVQGFNWEQEDRKKQRWGSAEKHQRGSRGTYMDTPTDLTGRRPGNSSMCWKTETGLVADMQLGVLAHIKIVFCDTWCPTLSTYHISKQFLRCYVVIYLSSIFPLSWLS